MHLFCLLCALAMLYCPTLIHTPTHSSTHTHQALYDDPRGLNTGFVGRPFALEDAEEHLSRLRTWGLTFIRLLVTWEAVEHLGPGQYVCVCVCVCVCVLCVCLRVEVQISASARQYTI